MGHRILHGTPSGTLLGMPCQLPASHAEDAVAGVGAGFPVTCSVHAGSLGEDRS